MISHNTSMRNRNEIFALVDGDTIKHELIAKIMRVRLVRGGQLAESTFKLDIRKTQRKSAGEEQFRIKFNF